MKRSILIAIAGAGAGAYYGFSRENITNGSCKKNDTFAANSAKECIIKVNQYGLSFVTGAIDTAKLKKIKRRTDKLRLGLFDQQIVNDFRQENTNNRFGQTTAGRFHCLQHSLDFESHDVLMELEEDLKPYVEDFFPGMKFGEDVRLSELQLLVSEPESVDQFFHQDNRCRGITIFMPLCDVEPEMGPTEFLVGSNDITSKLRSDPELSWVETFTRITNATKTSSEFGPASPSLPEGSLLVYDSRTLHRGLSNKSDKSRPCLIFRYDYIKCPPPGHTLASTFIFRIGGSMLYQVSRYMHAFTSSKEE